MAKSLQKVTSEQSVKKRRYIVVSTRRPQMKLNDTCSHPDIVGQRLIECFNGGPISSLEGLTATSLLVNSALLGSDRRSNALITQPIAALVGACRSNFPGVTFCGENVRPYDGGLVLTWSMHFRPDGHGNRVLNIPCTCRVRITGGKLCELWFVLDDYSMLLQLGKVCPDPGQPTGRSEIINRLAAETLSDAFVMRNTVRNTLSLSLETVVHANIETYRDLARGVDTETFRLEGASKFSELLSFVWNKFSSPVDLSLKSGISQGYTTTFRGRIRARIGMEMQTYSIVCGFVSPGDRVAECWVKVTPPPTLMECIM